jgi:hypothetical protein
MMLAPLILLVPIGVGLLTFSFWLRSLLALCQGRFISSGFWLCIALWVTNLLWLQGESYPMSLYETVMVVAVIADIWKMMRRWRKAREAEQMTYAWRDKWSDEPPIEPMTTYFLIK